MQVAGDSNQALAVEPQDVHFGYQPAERTEEVLAEAEDFLFRHAVNEHQRRLFSTALVGLKAQSRELEYAVFLHLPLLVYAGLRGDDRPAIPLAATTSLLFLGMDILDDLADGDQPAHWAGYGAGEINLAAATLLCAIPQLAIAELDAPADCINAMQQRLAEGLLQMSAGQQRDLALAGSEEAGADEVQAILGTKGEEMAIFAALAAHLAGATTEIVETCAALGRAIGTAGQLSSDCYDIFTDPDSRDLAHGTRTLPIALHLERQTGEERARFLALLDQAREDAGMREAVRQRLIASGEMRHCAFITEVYCQRAYRALEQMNPLEPARSGLRAMIDSVSFFPKGITR